MISSPQFDDDAVVHIAGLTAASITLQLESIRNRLSSLLPTRCLREIEDGETPKSGERAMERLVMCEAAVAALRQTSRSLCDEQDELNQLHKHFVRETRRHKRNDSVATGADRVARRLRGLTWQTDGEFSALLGRLTLARMLGLRSVLLAQLDREFELRNGNGRPISPDLILPDGSSGGGGDPELELLPVESKGPEDSKDGGTGGGGDGGGAAPAVVVVATVPPNSTVPGADVHDDEEDDGLDFLDLDRKA